MLPVLLLLVGTCALLWLVLSAPVGRRTVRQLIVVRADAAQLWNALYPFGRDFVWNGAVIEVVATGPDTGRMITSHMGRDGEPIEREFAISNAIPGERFTLRYTNDTSLAQSFWDHHVMTVSMKQLGNGRTVAEITETDRYHGIAFLIFRFFALRRQAIKLKRWAETGRFRPGGVFEHPLTQIGMGCFSTLLIWPFFGFHTHGFFLAVTLTVVVALHELGHMAAFRMMGHQTARMVFIPLLGGIALGGRPYDKHFEIGFSALMGAGFSAFPVAAATWLLIAAPGLLPRVFANGLTAAVLIAALFNLGNLMPVWKFDGGQVVRQLFKSDRAMAGASFATLMAMAAAAWAAGIPSQIMIIAGAVLAILGMMTSRNAVKPKSALTPMSSRERLAVALAFMAVVAIHACVLAWSVPALLF